MYILTQNCTADQFKSMSKFNNMTITIYLRPHICIFSGPRPKYITKLCLNMGMTLAQSSLLQVFFPHSTHLGNYKMHYEKTFVKGI